LELSDVKIGTTTALTPEKTETWERREGNLVGYEDTEYEPMFCD
jgi:hypothetical protein